MCLYWHSIAVHYIHCITTRTFHMVYNERVYYCVTASPLHLLPRSIHSYCQCPPPMLKLGKRTHKCSTAQHFKSFSFSTLQFSIYSILLNIFSSNFVTVVCRVQTESDLPIFAKMSKTAHYTIPLDTALSRWSAGGHN